MHREQEEKTCVLLCYFATEPLNDFWQLSLPLLHVLGILAIIHTQFTLRNNQVQVLF